jgi:hypothetical protein
MVRIMIRVPVGTLIVFALADAVVEGISTRGSGWGSTGRDASEDVASGRTVRGVSGVGPLGAAARVAESKLIETTSATG